MTLRKKDLNRLFKRRKPPLEEQITREILGEMRAKRRWGIFFKISFLVYLTVLIVLWTPKGSEIQIGEDSTITGLVRLEGVIGADGVGGVNDTIKDLRRAFKDDRTKAIILSINSPGGSPVQSSNVSQEIKRLREDFPKKLIYTVIEDICASGGYFVASATDQIFANESSLVGSIGVRFDSFGFDRSLDRLGIERRLITAGTHKGMLDPFLPIKEDELKHIETLLAEIHKQFINAVKAGRGDKLKPSLEDLFTGKIWTGKRGKELGLVDELGSIEHVAKYVIKAEKIVDFTRQKYPWEDSLGLHLKSVLYSLQNLPIW